MPFETPSPTFKGLEREGFKKALIDSKCSYGKIPSQLLKRQFVKGKQSPRRKFDCLSTLKTNSKKRLYKMDENFNLSDFPPLPESKNYANMIENIDTNVKGLDTALREIVKTMQEQNKVIKDAIEINKALQERLDSYNPANN